MGTPENLNIGWSDYESHLCLSVKDLRNDSTFSDVTLVCGKTQVKAHKVILSSFSLFFSRVLHDNPHTHPLIYLSNVKMKNLMWILDYMYSGQVQVGMEDVDSLLEMFKEFEIKGFDLLSNKTRKRKSNQNIKSPVSPPSKRKGASVSWAPDLSMADVFHDEIGNHVISSSATTWIGQDVLDDMLITSCDEDQLTSAQDDYSNGGVGDVSEIDLAEVPIDWKLNQQEAVDALIVSGGDKTFECMECSYKSFRKYDLKRHIEALHLPGIYDCPWPNCHKILTTDKGRRRHVKEKHGEK